MVFDAGGGICAWRRVRGVGTEGGRAEDEGGAGVDVFLGLGRGGDGRVFGGEREEVGGSRNVKGRGVR